MTEAWLAWAKLRIVREYVFMQALTEIETRALREIFRLMGLGTASVQDIVEGLRVERREFSEDTADSQRCVGEFIYFLKGDPLPIDDPPTHRGVWATHPDMPGGADFLLFLERGVPKVLEIGFFGSSMPKDILRGSGDRFIF